MARVLRLVGAVLFHTKMHEAGISRVGSGAEVPFLSDDASIAPPHTTETDTSQVGNLGGRHQFGAEWSHRLQTVLTVFASFGVMFLVLHMQPGGGARHREPPSWNPENERHYSFRAWMADITLWTVLTDLNPAQQCAAIVLKLGGAARAIGRHLQPQEILTGGLVQGRHLDPVSFFMVALHNRFAALEEESRMTACCE